MQIKLKQGSIDQNIWYFPREIKSFLKFSCILKKYEAEENFLDNQS